MRTIDKEHDGPMSRFRQARIVVAVMVPVAILVALLAWGVSSPPGSGPDDDYHMASIWCAGGIVEGRCEPGTNEEQRRLPGDLVEAARCFSFTPDQSASCPLAEGEMLPTTRGNWLGHAYPPLYYSVMNLFVTDDLSASIVLMRSVNALLYVGVLTALFFLLPRVQRHVLIWGGLITAVPLGMFLIPSVNPSGWAVMSATGLWLASWGYFSQTGYRKWLLAAMSALLLVIGAGARTDAAAYGVIALLAGCVIAFRRDRRFAIDLILPIALGIVAVLFFFSGGQSAIVSGDTAVVDQPLQMTTLAFVNLKLLPSLWTGVFGLWGLGWLDTPMPGVVWATALTMFGALAFWGLRVGDFRKWIAVIGVSASLVVVPMYILLHDGVIIGEYVQPRYIYPLMIMFGGIILFGFLRADLRLGRLQLIVVGAGLAVANSVALHVNMRRYITGLDDPNFNLNSPIEWWWNTPIAPMTVWAAGSVAFAVALAALIWLVWRRGDDALDAGDAALTQASRSSEA